MQHQQIQRAGGARKPGLGKKAGRNELPRRTALARERLPNRRACETFNFQVEGLRYCATVSWFADGRVGEVFIDNHKVGSQSHGNATDAAVAASLALRHGCTIDVLQRALLRGVRGRATTPLGVALDLVAKREGSFIGLGQTGIARGAIVVVGTKPFCIISQTVHIPGFKDAKEYRRAVFEEAWSAYLPGQNPPSREFCPSDPSKRPNHDGMGTSCNFRSVQAAAPDGSKNANLSYSHAGLDAWTDRKAGNGVKGHSGQEIAPDPTDPGPIPEFLLRTAPRRCDYCGSMLGAMNPWDWPGRPDGIWLHPRGEAGWMNSGGRS